MISSKEKRYKDADILRLIQNTLTLMFKGWVCFNDDGLAMVKPTGPEPTPEMERLFEERIANAGPLIRRAFVEVMNRQPRDSTKK